MRRQTASYQKSYQFQKSLDANAPLPYDERMGSNINYKDTLFTRLFNDPDVLRELYSALEGVSLPPDIPVTINTLENVLYKNMFNDISFEIGGKLVVLIEHQSTVNPNMAIRLLMYIGRIYEKLIEGKKIYSEKRIAIPRPEFFVLYNGTAPCPDEQWQRLSDAFEDTAPLGIAGNGSPSLDLAVKVVNINAGKNEGIANRCRTLAEYQALVSKVRGYEEAGSGREEAIKKAIQYCQSHDIMREFLEKHASEVLNMLMAEWNLDDALAVRYEEGWEEGREEGWEEGREDIARNALAKGIPVETIADITGLDIEAIKSIQDQE